MALQVSIRDAKIQFSKLIAKVAAGEEIVITKTRKAVARLVPIEEPKLARRIFGIDKGKIWMSDDAFDPLTDEELKEWYGGPDDPLNQPK